MTVIVKNKVHYDIFPSVGSQRLQQSVPVSSLTFHLVAIVLSSLIIATIKNIGLEHISVPTGSVWHPHIMASASTSQALASASTSLSLFIL